MKRNIQDSSALQRGRYSTPLCELISFDNTRCLCSSIGDQNETQDYVVDPTDDVQF